MLEFDFRSTSGILLILFFTLGETLNGACFTKSKESSSIQRLCSTGGFLPANKTRNIGYQDISCTRGSGVKTRKPQAFDFDQWKDLVSSGQEGRWEAYQTRRDLPEPRLTGVIPYQTKEIWSFQKCEFVTSESYCGSKNVCANGFCTAIPRSCWADITYHEALDCSHENMEFSITYKKSTEELWNPDSEGFFDIIPNKYDLLPGEYEDIKISTSQVPMDLVLNPKVSIIEPWNKYSSRHSGSAIGAACVERAQYAYHVEFLTLERDKKHASPNPFILPQKMDGESIDPIEWFSKNNKHGKYILNAIPDALLLSDIAATYMIEIAEESRNIDKDNEVSDKFWKNTQVLIKLKEYRWWMHSKQINSLETNELTSVTTNINSLSENSEIKIQDFWKITLDGEDAKESIYKKKYLWPFNKLSGYKKLNLRPNHTYILEVSAYQKGVPFYAQNCKSHPNQPRCKKLLNRLARKHLYYSKPLVIPFRTGKFDQRTKREKFKNGWRLFDHILNAIGRKKGRDWPKGFPDPWNL